MSKDNPPKEDFTRLLKYFEEKRREDNEKNEKRFRELTAFIKNRSDLADPVDPKPGCSQGSRSDEPPSKKSKVDSDVDVSVLIETDSEGDDLSDSEEIDRDSQIEEEIKKGNSIEVCADDEEMTELMAELSDSETLAPPLSEAAAKLINERFRCSLDKDASKAYGERYPRPSNADGLVTPTCNKEVWRNMHNKARFADLTMSSIQKQLAQAATVQSHILTNLNKLRKEFRAKDIGISKEECQETLSSSLKMLGESLVMTGSAFHHLSLKRRKDIMPCLQSNLADLASDSAPVSGQLFGDHLSVQVQEMKDLNKTASAIAGPSSALSHSHSQAHNHPFRGGQTSKNVTKYTNNHHK